MSKSQARKRRAAKTKHIQKFEDVILTVFRSNGNIYSQLKTKTPNGDRILVSCSTLDKSMRENTKGNKVEKAYQVGKTLAERAKEHNITHVCFDRNGYKYHGRIEALAKGAREAGLIF